MPLSKIRATYTPSHRRSINVWVKFIQVVKGGGQKKLNKLRRKSGGVIALEVCFTLPVVVYLIFFTIELIKINITQDALQSICEEATYLTIAHDYEDGADLTNKIDAIIEKYRPTFIPAKAPGYTTDLQPVIRWCFETYPNFDNMLRTAPYGGSMIVYSSYELDVNASRHAGQGYYANKAQFIPADGMECPANPENYSATSSYMTSQGLANNVLFVLTVTCNYPFSNTLVKWLFNGGINTRIVTFFRSSPRKATGPIGTMYLLWARGAGIVNAK